MPFVSLHQLLPDLAERETRAMHMMDGGPEPARSYLFTELFCDEPGCDCRRVFIQVYSDERGVAQPRATISWGWEPDRFYREWARFPLDDRDLDELRGPGLVRMAPQSKESADLLARFRMLLNDPAYAERIVRHYRAFRELIGSGAPTGSSVNRAERRRRKKTARRARRKR